MTPPQRKYSLRNRIALSAGVTFFLLLLAELSLRALYFQRNSGHRCAIVQYTSKIKNRLNASTKSYVYSRPLYRSDPVLGYSCNPGRHDLGVQLQSLAGLRSRTWRFTATLDAQGYRTTSSSSVTEPSRPEVWIYGCSYTWGWPLSNQETFAFLLQTSLANYTIRNLAGNGYGTVHALLHLRNELQGKNSRPVVVIVVYNKFHLVRNVAAPSRLREYRFVAGRVDFSGFQHPRAALGRDGTLSVDLVPLLPSDDPNPTAKHMESVTVAILDEIKALCDAHAILPVLAVQSDVSFGKVTQHCSEAGWHVIDMSLPMPLPDRYRLLPFDGHPNQAAHREYAAKLMKGLSPILNSRILHNKSVQAPP